MTHRTAAALSVSMALLGCAAIKARQGPPTFASRAPLDPLVAKLKASGGDPAAVLVVRGLVDLAKLKEGERYKFALREDGTLAVAPLPVSPPNDYTHPILAGGKPVRTAGQLRVHREDGRYRATLDQDSKAYCPTFASLETAREALSQVGVAGADVALADKPPVCLEEGETMGPGMLPAARDGGP